MVKSPPAKAGDMRNAGSIPGSGQSPGGRHSNPLQCSCLENPMNRGIWWAVVHRVSELDMTEATECKQFYIIAAVNLAPVTSTNAVCHQERFCQRSST